MRTRAPFLLGCPAWSVPEWRGNFLPAGAKRADFLGLYGRVFNTVEGNSTFYALASPDTARRWTTEVPPEFEFCFKMPRDITHGAGLLTNRSAVRAFIDILRIFAEAGQIGPAFLQVHASFGPDRLTELSRFLEQWPRDLPLAVEVRHPAFFQEGDDEARLEDLLRKEEIDRVIFDSRALYHSAPDDSVEAVSQTRKPRLPVRWRATGKRPFLRLVGRNLWEKTTPWLNEAAEVTAGWLEDGLRPCLFMHAPDDVLAPLLCRRFHEALRRLRPEIPELDYEAPHRGEQLELF